MRDIRCDESGICCFLGATRKKYRGRNDEKRPSAGWTQAKVKLNVWQPVLEQDLIRGATEMKEEVKADGLWVCERERVSRRLNLLVCGCVFVCLVALIIYVFATSFGWCLVIYFVFIVHRICSCYYLIFLSCNTVGGLNNLSFRPFSENLHQAPILMCAWPQKHLV